MTPVKNIIVVGGSFVGRVSRFPSLWGYSLTNTAIIDDSPGTSSCRSFHSSCKRRSSQWSSLMDCLWFAQVLLTETHSHFHHLFTFVSESAACPLCLTNFVRSLDSPSSQDKSIKLSFHTVEFSTVHQLRLLMALSKLGCYLSSQVT
jgi:hypothetical protein